MATSGVTTIPGQGTRTDMFESVRMGVDPRGVDITWESVDIGLDCLEKYGTWLSHHSIVRRKPREQRLGLRVV